MNREVVAGGGAGVYPLTGDVQSTAGNVPVTVTGLQGIPVQQGFPAGGEVLTYDVASNTWIPTVPPSGITLETNGTLNGSQTLLNLIAGMNISITDGGSGGITIAATSLGAQRSATTTNANGSYWTWTDGIIEAWGSVSIASSGSQINSSVVLFPLTFPTGVQNIQVTGVGFPNSGSPTDIYSVIATQPLASQFTARLECFVPTGGGGTTFNQAVIVHWRAIGS